MNRHKERCKPKDIEKCVLCEYKNSSQYSLYQHERLEHGINTRSKVITSNFKKREKMLNLLEKCSVFRCSTEKCGFTSSLKPQPACSLIAVPPRFSWLKLKHNFEHLF